MLAPTMRDLRKRPIGRTRPRRRVLAVVGLILVLGLAGFGLAAALTLRTLPPPEELFSRRIVQSTKIYDRTGGVLLYEIHGEERRTVIPFAEIPAAVKNATVAGEDAAFYRHLGIDLRGIARALLADLATLDLRQGGSTITQQLVKNALLGRERTLARKVREAVYAVALEARLAKDEILNLYLNQIPYGQNAYGVEAAAQTYFGKRAGDLSVAESALLSSLPAAPSYYSPYGQHKAELMRRKDRVLERMAELGYLTPEAAQEAKSAELKFLPAAKNIRAPHFVMFVRDELIRRYGEEEVESGGLMVATTLDWELQEAAEKIIGESAERNEQLIAAKNMALTAVDPKTGQILAMVGSRDYFDVAGDGNYNVATALRQPGSAFKPFVYATAFRKGLEPETVVFDVPTEFNPECAPEGLPRPGARAGADDCYHPGNYDEAFRGPVTLRQAIAQSLNVPSVKVLYLAGIEDSIRTAEDLGVTTLGDRSRFGLSLVLGGAEVKLLEMTAAAGTFANDGVALPTTALLNIKSPDGRVLSEWRPEARPAIDAEVARTINDVLSDNEARVPAFQPNSSLYFPGRRVAAKTGTTQEYRDAWTIGYTPSIAIGVWAGNNDNAPMRQKGSGVMAAAPAWHALMARALERYPEESFIPPQRREVQKPVLGGVWQGDTVVAIDTVSGKLATEFTPPETRRSFAFGQPHDPLYWIDRRDVTGPPPGDPAADPQYRNWEAAFERWLATSGFKPEGIGKIPQGLDDVHTAEKQPKLSVETKTAGDGSLALLVSVAAPYGLREVLLVADERVLVSRSRPISPVEFLIRPEDRATTGTLEVRAYDLVGNIGRVRVPPLAD